MRDVAEVFGNEPDRFFCGHPMAIIKSCQVYRARVPSQCAFAAQIEIDVEVTHGQLAQASIHRLAIATPAEIGFCYRAPVSANFENRDDVIGVLFRFQIEDQRWKANYAQGGSGENSAFET